MRASWPPPRSTSGSPLSAADRLPLTPEDPAVELRRLASDGVLEPRARRAVLVAADQGEPHAPASRRRTGPGGLTGREVDVLRLAARGLTTREIADRLVISPKTADHHTPHIHARIGISTRGE